MRKVLARPLVIAFTLLVGAALSTVTAATPTFASSTPAVAHADGHGQSVTPNTGGGCNDNVCITVNGSGLYVNYVFTQATNPNSYSVSSYPYITANGATIVTGSTRTIGAHTTSSFTWNAQRNFADGTVICAGWTGISGYPCATVHN